MGSISNLHQPDQTPQASGGQMTYIARNLELITLDIDDPDSDGGVESTLPLADAETPVKVPVPETEAPVPEVSEPEPMAEVSEPETETPVKVPVPEPGVAKAEVCESEDDFEFYQRMITISDSEDDAEDWQPCRKLFLATSMHMQYLTYMKLAHS